jgi:hypothetical protein
MVTEFLGGTLMIHGLAGSEAADAMGQAILVIGALAIIARIKMKSRSRRT